MTAYKFIRGLIVQKYTVGRNKCFQLSTSVLPILLTVSSQFIYVYIMQLVKMECNVNK